LACVFDGGEDYDAEMDRRVKAADYGRRSCLVFGIVAVCAVVGFTLGATAPPHSGGDFGGLNGLGQTLLACAFVIGGWALSLVGIGFGIAGLMQQGETTSATRAGLALKLLAAGGGVLWLLILNP